MPTVPIVYLFHYGSGGRVWWDDVGYTPWISNGQADLDGIPNALTAPDLGWYKQRIDNHGDIVDGADMGPVSIDLDIETLWPLDYVKNDLDPTFYNGTLTFPDAWFEMSWGFQCIVRQGFAYNALYYSPRFKGTTLIQPPRESEALPMEEPMPISISLATDQLSLSTILPVDRFGKAGFFTFRNNSFQTFALGGDIVVEWGDGETTTIPFAYSMPAADEAPTTSPGATPQMYTTHTCYFSIRTDADLAAPSTPTVVEDTADHVLVEMRIPLLTHYYDTLENANPRIFARSSAGSTSYQEHDPIPVANFVAADNGDLSNLEWLYLDGSRSFDLTDPIGLWFWYWTPVVNGVEPAYEPDGRELACRVYDNPILDIKTLGDGDYWVYLYAAVGGLKTGGVSGEPALLHNYEYDQISWVRRKRVTIGTVTAVNHDHDRLAWWHLQGDSGDLYVKRHDQYEAPGAGSEAVLVGPGSPASLTRAGTQLFVTAKNGDFYHSGDEGQTWSDVMAIGDGLTVIASAAEDDGSAIYHLAQDDDGSLQRVVMRYNGGGWEAGEPEAVAGLPDSTRRPGSAHKSGVLILLAAKDDDGYFAAVSSDNMVTWTVYS